LLQAKADIEEVIKAKKESQKTWWKFEVDPKRIEKAFEALKQAWVPEDYLKLVRWAGIDDISTLAHYRSWLVDWKIRQHIEEVAQKRGLTPTEAHTIFWYTKWVFSTEIGWTDRINMYLRWKLPDDLPKSQKEALGRIVKAFDDWLDKNPNVEWNLVLIWDSWNWWRVPKWSEIDLYWYTSWARKKENILTWERHPNRDLLIEVKIIEWRAKDISELAYYTNFAKAGKTTEEAVILRNSKVIIKDIQEWYDRFVAKTWETVNITKIRAEQTK
jgi:hypothetical protein